MTWPTSATSDACDMGDVGGHAVAMFQDFPFKRVVL